MAENDNKEKEKAAAAKPLEDDPKEKETATAAAKPLEEKDDDPSEEPPPKKIKKLRVKGDDDTRASGNIFDDKGRIIRTLNWEGIASWTSADEEKKHQWAVVAAV